MKNITKKVTLIAILAVGFLSFGYPCFNQPRPAFVYKPVPKRFMSALNANDSYESERATALSTAYDLTRSLPAGYVKDGSVDYTKTLQSGIDTHQNIIFPNFPVLVGTAGLTFKANTSVLFAKDSKVLLAPNALQAYVIFKIYDADNVKMFAPVVVGDRVNHTGTGGEAGIGIKIGGSSNVKLYRPQVSNCWGDGIYVGNSPRNVSDGIVIDKARLDNNRRNGLTVAAGKNISITNAVVTNTNGTAPMTGIDIEPNNSKTVIDNIAITNYMSYNNAVAALMIGLSRLPGPQAKALNIKVDGLTARGSYVGITLGGFYARPENRKLDGNIELSNINIVDAQIPVKTASNYDLGPAIHLRGVKFLKTNPSGSEEPTDAELGKLRSRLSKKLNISMDQ
ncbi:MAG TPA: right-handed parallel beta-helix repeat-containing protein [Mucilaginibacter sp.]